MPVDQIDMRFHERIILVPLTERFVNQKYLSWVNDPEVTEFLEIGDEKYNLEDLLAYVRDSQLSGRLNYAIITEETNQHIGNASIYGIDKTNKKFNIGWFIGEKDFWGGHFAPMVIFYLHKIGFTELELEFNAGSVHEKHFKARMTNKFVGYSEGEKFSAFSKKHGKHVTLVRFNITKHDWLLKAKELEIKFPKYYRLV